MTRQVAMDADIHVFQDGEVVVSWASTTYRRSEFLPGRARVQKMREREGVDPQDTRFAKYSVHDGKFRFHSRKSLEDYSERRGPPPPCNANGQQAQRVVEEVLADVPAEKDTNIRMHGEHNIDEAWRRKIEKTRIVI